MRSNGTFHMGTVDDLFNSIWTIHVCCCPTTSMPLSAKKFQIGVICTEAAWGSPSLKIYLFGSPSFNYASIRSLAQRSKSNEMAVFEEGPIVLTVICRSCFKAVHMDVELKGSRNERHHNGFCFMFYVTLCIRELKADLIDTDSESNFACLSSVVCEGF